MTECRESQKHYQTGPSREHTDSCTRDLCAHWKNKNGVWQESHEMAFILTTDGILHFKIDTFSVCFPLIPESPLRTPYTLLNVPENFTQYLLYL